MKKFINIAFTYAILALACGVFYREFTKLSGFTGRTTLAFTHLHLFVLGTLVFLLIALFTLLTDLAEKKQFKTFMILYNVALPYMIIMFFVRGILQVKNTVLSSGINAAISGVAGIGHILMAIAFVLFFLCLRNSNFKHLKMNK